jgi:hypothetical protein
MATTICVSQELSRFYENDACFLLDQIVEKIDKAIYPGVDENLRSLLMECMLIIIEDRTVQTNMDTCIRRFKEYGFESRLDELSNKHRFQMYDIFEAIEKIEKKKRY